MLKALAVGVPLRACQPSITSAVPAGRSSFRHPARYSAFTDEVSNAQFTSCRRDR